MPGPLGTRRYCSTPVCGRKSLKRILRGDAAFDCMTARMKLAARTRRPMHPHRLPVRDAQLLAYEIHTIHELGDGMLDLNTACSSRGSRNSPEGVSRNSMVPALNIADRARPPLVAASDRRRRSAGDTATDGDSSMSFLVAPLDAALPLAERGDTAAVIGQNLDLDVPRPLEILLDVQGAVAERVSAPPRRAAWNAPSTSASLATSRHPPYRRRRRPPSA